MKKIFTLILAACTASLSFAETGINPNLIQDKAVDLQEIRANMVNGPVNTDPRAATINLTLDYDLADQTYSDNNGFDYAGFRWDLNTNYQETDALTLGWILTRFDVLYDNDNDITYPYASSTVTIDSLDFIIAHWNTSGNNDVIISTIFEVNGAGQVTANVLWSDTNTINTSLSPAEGDFVDYLVYPNLQLAQGQAFAAEIRFTGDTATSSFEVVADYRNECGTTCGANPSFITNDAGFENTLHFGNWGTFSGVNQVFADCNGNQQNDTPNGDCEEWYLQNFLCIAFTTVDIEFSGSATVTPPSGCEGDFAMIDLTVAGAQGNTTVTWTGDAGNTGSLSSMTAEDPIATIGTGDDIWTAMIIDQNNDTAWVNVNVNSNAITLAPINDVNINCGSTGSMAAIASGELAGVTYEWSNGTTTFSAAGLTPGNYSVTVTNSFGCEDVENAIVAYNGVATNSVDFSVPTVCQNQSVTYTNASDRTNGWSWEWDFEGDGSSLGFSEDGTHTYANLGSYDVVLTADSAGCEFSVEKNVTVVVCNSIEEMSFLQNFELVPNPASNYVTVTVTGLTNDAVISVVDLTGKVISSEVVAPASIHKSNIDLSEVANGLYLVQIQSNEESASLKLSVNK